MIVRWHRLRGGTRQIESTEPHGKTCGVIRDNPLVDRPVEEMEGAREFPILRTPLSFICRDVDDRIEVLRVREAQWAAGVF